MFSMVEMQSLVIPAPTLHLGKILGASAAIADEGPCSVIASQSLIT
jgi:hypothetical protein